MNIKHVQKLIQDKDKITGCKPVSTAERLGRLTTETQKAYTNLSTCYLCDGVQCKKDTSVTDCTKNLVQVIIDTLDVLTLNLGQTDITDAVNTLLLSHLETKRSVASDHPAVYVSGFEPSPYGKQVNEHLEAAGFRVYRDWDLGDILACNADFLFLTICNRLLASQYYDLGVARAVGIPIFACGDPISYKRTPYKWYTGYKEQLPDAIDMMTEHWETKGGLCETSSLF